MNAADQVLLDGGVAPGQDVEGAWKASLDVGGCSVLIGRSLPVLSSDADFTTSPALGPARPERKDAQKNRAKILGAARTLMENRGLDGVCMDQLAAAAGVGKGTLYRRFQDKHALFRALLDDDERTLQDAVRKRFGHSREASPHLVLSTLWGALVDFVLDHRDVLAAAEVEARNRVTLLHSGPYHWRQVELVRWMVACGLNERRAVLMARAWLQTLAADVMREAVSEQGIDDVRDAWRSIPDGLRAAVAAQSQSRPTTPTTPN